MISARTAIMILASLWVCICVERVKFYSGSAGRIMCVPSSLRPDPVHRKQFAEIQLWKAYWRDAWSIAAMPGTLAVVLPLTGMVWTRLRQRRNSDRPGFQVIQ